MNPRFTSFPHVVFTWDTSAHLETNLRNRGLEHVLIVSFHHEGVSPSFSSGAWTIHPFHMSSSPVFETKNVRILCGESTLLSTMIPKTSKKQNVLITPRQEDDGDAEHMMWRGLHLVCRPEAFFHPKSGTHFQNTSHQTFVYDVCAEKLQVLEGEKQKDTARNIYSEIPSLRFMNTPSYWIDVFLRACPSAFGDKSHVDTWKEWVQEPHALITHIKDKTLQLPTDCADEKLRDTIHAFVDSIEGIRAPSFQNKGDDDNHPVRHKPFEIQSIEWSYILCFGQDCRFVFDQLENQVYCIGGKNGYGKTSFLEIVCLALFGKGFPSRVHASDTDMSYVCKKKPDDKDAYTDVRFFLDGILFGITRCFDKKGGATLYVMTGGDKQTICDHVSDVAAWIDTNIGTMESFLTSCMITQTSDHDFFALSSDTQKRFIYASLKLYCIRWLESFLRDVYQRYHQLRHHLDKDYQDKTHQHMTCFADVCEARHTELERKVTTLKNDLRSLDGQFRAHKETCHTNALLVHSLQNYSGAYNDEHAFKKDIHDMLKEKYDKLGIVLKKMGAQKWDVSSLLEEIGAMKHQLKLCQDAFDPSEAQGHDEEYYVEKQKDHAREAEKRDKVFLLNMSLPSIIEERRHHPCKSSTPPHDTRDIITEIEEITSQIEALSVDKHSMETRMTEMLSHPNERPFFSKEHHEMWQQRISFLDEKYEQDAKTRLPQKLHGLQYEQSLLRKPYFQTKNDLKKAELKYDAWQKENVYPFQLSIDHLRETFIGLEDELHELRRKIIDAQLYIDSELRPEYEDMERQFQEIIAKKPLLSHTCDEECDGQVADESVVREAEGMTDDHAKTVRDYLDKFPLLKTAMEIYKQQLHEKQNDIQWIERLLKTPNHHTPVDEMLHEKRRAWKKQVDVLAEKVLSMSRFVCNKDRFDSKKRVLNHFLSRKYKDWINEQEENSRSRQKMRQKIAQQESWIHELESKVSHICAHLHQVQKTQMEWDREYKDLYTHITNDKADMTMYMDIEQKIAVLQRDYEQLQDLLSEEDAHRHSAHMRTMVQEKANLYKTMRTEVIQLSDHISQLERMRYAKQLQHDYEKHTFWAAWEADHAKYGNVIASFRYKKRLQDLNYVFTLLQDKESIYRDIESIEEIIPFIDEWFNGKRLATSIQEKEEELSQMQLTFFMHLEKLKKKTRLQRDLACFQDVMVKIDDDTSCLSHILTMIDRYEEWSLEHTVLPMLVQHANALLSLLCQHHRPLRLEYQLHKTGSDMSIGWFVRDNGMLISLSKASGFQKCVINLIMRLTLGKMGVSDVSNTQLFIDEGFTACDQANLRSVPEFLQSLLHVYKNVILVTHIDELKNHFGYQIPIHMGMTGLSILQNSSGQHVDGIVNA